MSTSLSEWYSWNGQRKIDYTDPAEDIITICNVV